MLHDRRRNDESEGEMIKYRTRFDKIETRDVCAVHAVALPDNAKLCGERSKSERTTGYAVDTN